MTPRLRSWLALAALAGLMRPAAAQDSSHPHPGVELRLAVVQTPAWSLEERTGTFVNRHATYEAGPMVGVGVAAAPVRWAAAFGTLEWNGGGLGDGSGFSLAEIGIRGQVPTGTRLVPMITGVVGRLSESGGVSFAYLGLGVGAQYFLGRRLAVGVGVQRLDPGATRVRDDPGPGPGPVATVDARMTRVQLTLSLWL